MTPKEKLQAHSAEFRRELIQVTDNVYVGVGYGASNSIMIEGQTGLIIVDTLESTSAAEGLYADFRQISDKPVLAIFYTHSHRDHVSGATVFAAGATPDIYARPAATNMLGAKEVAEIARKRAKRQFAIGMPSWVRINLGIGPAERPLKGLGAGFMAPNHLIEAQRKTFFIDGIRLECVAAPGETPDTMVIWLPEQRLLIGADNYYKSFPNLYPIRGNAYRDVALWIESLNIMLSFEAEHLIPGHSRPLHGVENIREVLTNYRDGIEHVLKTTLAGINRGLTPDELVEVVKLPPHLADNPYLQEYYGTIAWSVRAIFTGYLGWFDGNPTNMFPLAKREEAQNMAKLAGGAKVLLQRLEEAVASGNHQWALQLADYLLALDYASQRAKELKAQAMTALAEEQLNATARHYYLTYAHELRGEG